MRTHESLADNRLRFAAKLSEMSDELTTLAKEVDRNRKQARETGLRLERNLQDAEAGVEKVRAMSAYVSARHADALRRHVCASMRRRKIWSACCC